MGNVRCINREASDRPPMGWMALLFLLVDSALWAGILYGGSRFLHWTGVL